MCDLSYDRRKANWKSQQAATLFKLQECCEGVSKTLLRKLKIGGKAPAFQQMDFHERSGNIVESNRHISFFYCQTVAVIHIHSANRQNEILSNCCSIHPVGGCGKGHIERCVSFCNPQTDAHARLSSHIGIAGLSMCTCRLIVSTARHRRLYHGMCFP